MLNHMRTVSGNIKELDDHRRKEKAQVSVATSEEFQIGVISKDSSGYVINPSIQLGGSDRCSAIIYDCPNIFGEGLSRLLSEFGFDILLAAEASSQIMRPAHTGVAQVIFCCVPDRQDLDETVGRLRQLKNGSTDLRVVVLADTISSKLLSLAYEADVDAVLSTKVSVGVLKGAIELVMLGQRVYPTRPTASPARELGVQRDRASPEEFAAPGHVAALSEREDQILRFLASGTRNKLIAYDLGISEATVKFHIRALLRKLGAVNRTQAAILGVSRSMASKPISPASIRPVEENTGALRS